MSDDISIPSPTYRVSRRRGMDPATKRLALIAAGLGGALVVVVGGWSLLDSGPHTVPVVQAPSGPVRVKPADPGGLQVAGSGNAIFSGDQSTAVDKLAPPPEVPDPQALRPPPPKPAPPAEHLPAARVQTGPAAAASSAGAAPAQHAMTVEAARPAPVRSPARSGPAEPTRSGGTPARAETRPAETHRVARATPAEPAQAARVGSGGAMVQLAALSSEQAAKTAWQNLNRRIPGLLDGHQPVFVKVSHGGKTFWRLRTGGFRDEAQARAFCRTVKAKGLGCFPAELLTKARISPPALVGRCWGERSCVPNAIVRGRRARRTAVLHTAMRGRRGPVAVSP